MQLHPNAKWTPKTRRLLVERVRRQGWPVAQELEVPVSTVSRHLKALGLGRIWRLEEADDPPRRYEHRAPGAGSRASGSTAGGC